MLPCLGLPQTRRRSDRAQSMLPPCEAKSSERAQVQPPLLWRVVRPLEAWRVVRPLEAC